MKTNLTIKNFRVFDEKGATIELNPITILTGRNSSGKSSIVKAILLLNDYLTQIKKAFENNDEIELDHYKLDFYKFPFNLLGRFDTVVNEGSPLHSITFEYTTYSYMISKEVNVQLVFVSDDSDDLNNGYLHTLRVSTDEGLIYSSDKNEGDLCDLNRIKEACFEYLPIEYLVYKYCGLESGYEFGNIKEQDYETQHDSIIEYLRGCEKKRRADVIRHIRVSDKLNSITVRSKIDPAILEKPIEKGSMFTIPIIDKLNQIDKNKIKEYINEHFLQNAARNFVFGSNKIIDDFVNSDFAKFGDYFRQWEYLYLSEIRGTGFKLFDKSPALLKSGTIGHISQQHYWIDWYVQSGEVFSIGDIFNDGDKSTVPVVENRKQKDIDRFESIPICFDWLYETVMEWNRIAGNEGEGRYYSYNQYGFEPGSYQHFTLKLIAAFAEELIQEVIFPEWCNHIEYVSSSRAEVKRLYTLDDSDQFSLMLKHYFDAKRRYHNEGNKKHVFVKAYELDSFINKWIKAFHIGESVSISALHNGLGAEIYLHNSSGDKNRILADEGFGITQFFSILLQIETAILSAEGEKVNKMWGLDSLDGYASDKFHFEMNTIAIEEPEIHLHPEYQSKLADMMIEAYKKYNIHFIVETHSEYLIRKLQVIVAGKDDTDLHISNDDISILYVNSPKAVKENGESQVKRIEVLEDGRLDSPFGTGFFDESKNLVMKMLKF